MKVTILNQKINRYKNKTVAIIRAVVTHNGKDICSPEIFVGEAKCSPEDKYDFITGKRIALARAEIKAYKYYKNVLIELNDIYQTLATDSAKLYDKIRKQISHNKEYIGDIVSGSNN